MSTCSCGQPRTRGEFCGDCYPELAGPPERRWSGPLCGCGATQLTCECERDLNGRACCWGCEHTALPPDIRPNATPSKATT